ncbi:winged helix DNA-binding domain-containing protein [Kitasatospora sp. NPDC059795]|uniref:winged helix DNA-binding domain-containing protein n=1 Tax=Kitasatospora sp. NPDC059795 TaxID=3346949 RepID=UPI00364A3C88
MRALELDDDRVRALRTGGQGLGRPFSSAAETVERVVGIQAQDARAGALGIRVRTHALTAADLRRALEVDRTLVRGWFLRGTLHTVTTADLHWLLDLLGPHVLRLSARRHRELGLDENLCDRAETVITDALAAQGPCTRAELTRRLADAGLPADGQAPFHLIRRAALRGRICFGPDRDGDATYVLLADWLPDAPGDGPTGDAAVTALARRYLHAHGPAAPEDFVGWSGLPASAARRAWHSLDLLPVRVQDQDCALPADRADELDAAPGPTPDLRLLPMYDNYLVAHRTSALSVPAAHQRQVRPGGGLIRAAVLADGLACGTWSWRRDHADVTLFDPTAAPGLAAGIAAESADIARFLRPAWTPPPATAL